MSCPPTDWKITDKKSLDKKRIHLLCLEETIRQLPRIQYRMWEITGKNDNPPDEKTMEYCIRCSNEEYFILAEEYKQAMQAKWAMKEMTNYEWAEYIHQSASLEFYSELHKNKM